MIILEETDRIFEYKKLIKTIGLADALNTMKREGGLFKEGFIEKNSPIFSEEEINEFAEHLEKPEKTKITIPSQNTEWVIPSMIFKYGVAGQLRNETSWTSYERPISYLISNI